MYSGHKIHRQADIAVAVGQREKNAEASVPFPVLLLLSHLPLIVTPISELHSDQAIVDIST